MQTLIFNDIIGKPVSIGLGNVNEIITLFVIKLLDVAVGIIIIYSSLVKLVRYKMPGQT